MTVDEILEALTELFNKADIFDTHIIREVCNNSIYFIKQQQSELNRLQQENEQLKELLRLAVGDMASIADIIANSHELLADGEDEVRSLHLGRCDVCDKNCHNDDDDSDDGCNFSWQHADKLKGLIEI